MSYQTRRAFLQNTAFGLGTACSVGGIQSALGAAPCEMKFSICNETFGDWPFEKAFAVAAESGYTGIEIAPFTITNDVTDISAKQRAKIKRQVEKAGLETVGLHWLLAKTKGFYVTSPDRDVRRRTTKYLNELALLCADLGGNKMIFGSPNERNLLPGVTKQQAMKYAEEVFTGTLPTLEKTDVTMAIEPLDPSITTFLQTAAEAVELIEMVDSPRCKLILDCRAMSSEPTPIPELIRKYQSLLIHFHANDPNLLGPGFGKLDFVPIMKALCDINFKDWVSVEVFKYELGAERISRESIQYMKKCLAKA